MKSILEILDRPLYRQIAIYSLLGLFVVLYRWATAVYPDSIDSMYYWVAAKKILAGLPIDLIEHRTMRFGVILPVAVVQLIFGPNPYGYFIAPLFFSVALTLLTYTAGRMLSGEATGLGAALLVAVYPYMSYLGVQVLPSVFMAAYAMAAWVCLLAYVKKENGGAVLLALAALFLFGAYESKITSLYLMPGFALAPLIFRKSWRHVFLFLIVLLALYLLETALYITLGGPGIGRLGVFTGHMEQVYWVKEYSFIGLILRWFKMGPYWTLLLLAFVVALFYSYKKDQPRYILVFGVPLLIYYFIYTFAVRSAFPFITMEPTYPRYLTIALPATLIVIVHALVSVSSGLLSKEKLRAALVGALVMGLVAACMLIYDGWRAKATDRNWRNLTSMSRYAGELNKAYQAGTPIMTLDGGWLATSLYLRAPLWPRHDWRMAAGDEDRRIIVKDDTIWDSYGSRDMVLVESMKNTFLVSMPKEDAEALPADLVK